MFLKIKVRYKMVLAEILLSCVMILFFHGCNKSTEEAPDNTNNIWKLEDSGSDEARNTYKSHNGDKAKDDAYTYYSHEDFSNLVNVDNAVTIYEEAYQEAALLTLEQQKALGHYTLEHPLFILNPFGTNKTGLYVYLGTQEEKVHVSYIISTKDETIPDFSASMYMDTTNAGILEGQIIGLIRGMKNKVVLSIKDSSGNLLSKRIYYFHIPAYDSIFKTMLTSKHTPDTELTRGLYNLLAKDALTTHFLFYDNYGILRAEIPTGVTSKETKIVQADNKLFFAVTNTEFVLVDHLGHVVSNYSSEDNQVYTDYTYDSKKDCILLLGNGKDDGLVDQVVKLDLEKHEFMNLVDFQELFQRLREKADNAKEDKVTEEMTVISTSEDSKAVDDIISEDWLSLTSIELIGNSDIIVSSRELSAIIRINNIYSYPVVRWMIAEEQVVADTGYESLTLTKSGDFPSQAGQDAVYYIKGKKMKEGQYYLSFLNHNYGESKTRPDIIWNEIEGIGSPDEDALNSYYYRYYIDETQNRYKLVQKIALPYTTKNSMAMPYGNNSIISIGDENVFMEYNQTGEMVSQFILYDTDFSYKVYKYTMDRYWF